MSYTVHITAKAKQDLAEAFDYIEFVLCNPTAADRLVEEVDCQIALLSDFPEKHPLVEDPVLASWNIRFIPIKNYIAFYVVDKEKQKVFLVRFLYRKRNWISILRSEIALP